MEEGRPIVQLVDGVAFGHKFKRSERIKTLKGTLQVVQTLYIKSGYEQYRAYYVKRDKKYREEGILGVVMTSSPKFISESELISLSSEYKLSPEGLEDFASTTDTDIRLPHISKKRGIRL